MFDDQIHTKSARQTLPRLSALRSRLREVGKKILGRLCNLRVWLHPDLALAKYLSERDFLQAGIVLPPDSSGTMLAALVCRFRTSKPAKIADRLSLVPHLGISKRPPIRIGIQKGLQEGTSPAPPKVTDYFTRPTRSSRQKSRHPGGKTFATSG